MPVGGGAGTGGPVFVTGPLPGREGARWHSSSMPVRGVNELAFSPDGGTLLTGGETGVCLWEADTGSLSRELSGNHVHWVAFSPDGKTVAAAAEDDEGASPGCWMWRFD